MTTMAEATPGQDALVHEVGALIVRDERVAARPWDAYALVARVEANRIQLNGFAYEAGSMRPATPRGPEMHHKLKALRDAMREDVGQAWGACVVRIERETKKIRIEFEYDHPERWDVTPQTVADIAARARP